jgi:hypothetical protein
MPAEVGRGSVHLSHYVSEPGDYLIWARVLSPHEIDDAFGVEVDEGTLFTWDLPKGHEGWIWDRVSERDGADPKTFNLSEGWHRIRISSGGSQARIDALEFMRWDTQPDKDVQPCADPTPSAIELDLAQGYNLVSLPVVGPGTPIDQALQSAWASTNKVFAYQATDPTNPWRVHDTALPLWANTLADLGRAQGFWIHVDVAGEYMVNGQQPGTTEIHLYEGANLIGYPCMEVRAVTSVLAAIDGKWTKVYAYDPSFSADPWLVHDASWDEWRNEFTEFQPGRGYWIYVTEDCILTIVN